MVLSQCAPEKRQDSEIVRGCDTEGHGGSPKNSHSTAPERVCKAMP